MARFGTRYLVLVSCTTALFINFVACGAQFYKVSVSDDMQPERGITAAATNPESPTYGLHAPNGWNNLPIPFKVGFKLNLSQRAALVAAMDTWERAVGQKLFIFEGVHTDIDGDSFSDLYSSLNDMINGHYFDHDWQKTGKPEVVLATTIWENSSSDYSTIVTSDIRFNDQNYNIGDSYVLGSDGIREVVDMESLSLHELGHLLGLAHVKPSVDNYSIMNPALYIGEGMTNRRLSEGDIARIQKIYGCQNTACDIAATLATIEKKAKSDGTTEEGPAAVVPIEIETTH